MSSPAASDAGFEMDTEREAYVQSLSKFTYLSGGIKEMKPKNVECARRAPHGDPLESSC